MDIVRDVPNRQPDLMRKLIKYLVGFVLLLTAGWLIVHTFHAYRVKKEAAEKIQTLQQSCFESLHGGQICLDGFNPNQPTVILYFHPECEHCQYEATEIGRQPELFAKANMILITSADSINRIKAFVDKYKLWQVDNLVILLDRKGQFKKQFGTSVVPSVFIYGANKRLLKQFSGEVKMEAVLKIIE